MKPTSEFEIVTTSLGAISIRDNLTHEIMHNPVGPWVEANALYIEQSQLARRLRQDIHRELVIYDVGLGAAANALATLHCARGIKDRRQLRLISFERNIDLLQFALDHADQFDHFRGYEAAVQAILNKGHWQEEGIHWELRHGDFLDLVERENTPAQLVYFDPYSSRKNSEMWTAGTFQKILAKSVCSETEGTVLYTYSRATPVRVALLRAGFFVGTGVATGAKEETTQASTRLEALANPLGLEWLGRWQRSHLHQEEDRPFVLNHPQFKVRS